MLVPARAIAQRKIISHFIERDATSPRKAIAFQPERLVHRRAFERLQRGDVVRSGGVDRWYFDLPSYQRLMSSRRTRVLTAAILAASLGAVFNAIR